MKSKEYRDTNNPLPPDEVDELLSSSLLGLKFEDRNDMREELHGVRSLAREESPELINDSLLQMEIELDSIMSASRDNEHAFQLARDLPKTFVNDRDFRLKFLRCERFDPAKAADRMIVHLNYLLQLFGQRSLEEPLNAGFFVKEEAAALREGNFQLMPFRDRSGRRILCVMYSCLEYSPLLRVRSSESLTLDSVGILKWCIMPGLMVMYSELYFPLYSPHRFIFWVAFFLHYFICSVSFGITSTML